MNSSGSISSLDPELIRTDPAPFHPLRWKRGFRKGFQRSSFAWCGEGFLLVLGFFLFVFFFLFGWVFLKENVMGLSVNSLLSVAMRDFQRCESLHTDSWEEYIIFASVHVYDTEYFPEDCSVLQVFSVGLVVCFLVFFVFFLRRM